MKGHEDSCPLGIFSRWPRCHKIAGIGIFVLASSVLENKLNQADTVVWKPLRMRQQMVDKKRNDMMRG